MDESKREVYLHDWVDFLLRAQTFHDVRPVPKCAVTGDTDLMQAMKDQKPFLCLQSYENGVASYVGCLKIDCTYTIVHLSHKSPKAWSHVFQPGELDLPGVFCTLLYSPE